MPRCMSLMAPNKVTIPSGKLWIAIPAETRTPVFISLLFFFSLSVNFSSSYSCGIKNSIAAIVAMPKKKEMFAIRNPVSTTAKNRSSMNEICIMTPAEKPISTERCLCLKSFMKNATRLPRPVDNPAIREKRKAISIVSVIKAPKAMVGNQLVFCQLAFKHVYKVFLVFCYSFLHFFPCCWAILVFDSDDAVDNSVNVFFVFFCDGYSSFLKDCF